MQVGAFDEVIRQPDDFSQRIARNTQLGSAEGMQPRSGDRSGGRFLVCRKSDGRTGGAEPGHCSRRWKSWAEWRRLCGGFPAKDRGGHGCRETESGVAPARFGRGRKPIRQSEGKAAGAYRQLTQRRFTRNDVSTGRFASNLDGGRARARSCCRSWPQSWKAKGRSLFEACVEAAAPGLPWRNHPRGAYQRYTLPTDHAGLHDPGRVPVLSVCDPRRTVTGPHRQAARRSSCATWAVERVQGASRFLARVFRRGRLRSASHLTGSSTPEEAADAFGKSEAKVASSAPRMTITRLWCPHSCRDPGQETRQPSWCWLAIRQDQVEALQKAGVDEFIHIRADAAAHP